MIAVSRKSPGDWTNHSDCPPRPPIGQDFRQSFRLNVQWSSKADGDFLHLRKSPHFRCFGWRVQLGVQDCWKIFSYLLVGSSFERPAYFQDGPELGRTDGTLSLVLSEIPEVARMPTHEVHCWQFQGRTGHGTFAVLEHTCLQEARRIINPSCCTIHKRIQVHHTKRQNHGRDVVCERLKGDDTRYPGTISMSCSGSSSPFLGDGMIIACRLCGVFPCGCVCF